MIKSIIHAGGESTRLKEIFDGPKALIPVENKTLLWFHLQPLLRCKIIKDYIFTLRYKSDVVKDYIKRIENEFDISAQSIIEPKPLGRAGSVKLGIERGIININESYIMSNPDDLVPININQLVKYSTTAEKEGKCIIMVMSKKATNPFGIGITKKTGKIIELKEFQEKPELPFIENHFANTGMILFLPDAMKEFANISLAKPTHPENEIIPRFVKENRVAVFLVDRWISVNYTADYKHIQNMGMKKLLKFLNA